MGLPDEIRVSEYHVLANSVVEALCSPLIPKKGSRQFANSRFVCEEHNVLGFEDMLTGERWYQVVCIFRIRSVWDE